MHQYLNKLPPNSVHLSGDSRTWDHLVGKAYLKLTSVR